MHGVGTITLGALQTALVDLQERLALLADIKLELLPAPNLPQACIPKEPYEDQKSPVNEPCEARRRPADTHTPQPYTEHEPHYRRPGLLAPPPPPGIAPVEIPVKLDPEIIPEPEFVGEEERVPEFVEPVLEEVPPQSVRQRILEKSPGKEA